MTPGDARPTANVFWMGKHQSIIPKVEGIFRDLGFEPVWLHNNEVAISSPFMAKACGEALLRKAGNGDILVPLTTGWNFPEYCGIVLTMAQDMIKSGQLKVIHVCNMEETAPGYVGQRANVLICEIMELPYHSLTVLGQTSEWWEEFKEDLRAVIDDTYTLEIPKAKVVVESEHRKIAEEAIKFLRKSGGIVPLFNVASMTMAQGWPNYPLFKLLGLTPIFIGSNQFSSDMNAVAGADVQWAYSWLKDHGLNFVYESGGLCEDEIFSALQMYLAKLAYWKLGAIGMGTQGQMDMTKFGVATDLSEALMMTSLSPGKIVPVIDVTEADCEALWTSLLMQAIIYIKTGKWVAIGFHDMRHYDVLRDLLILLNSGALAFDFLCDEPGDYSDIFIVSQDREVYFLNGGGCVKGNMRPVERANLLRVHGRGAGYKMLASVFDILSLTWAERENRYSKLDAWPMGTSRVPGDKTRIVTLKWVPNHGQHCNEYILPEIAAACEILGVPFHCFSA